MPQTFPFMACVIAVVAELIMLRPFAVLSLVVVFVIGVVVVVVNVVVVLGVLLAVTVAVAVTPALTLEVAVAVAVAVVALRSASGSSTGRSLEVDPYRKLKTNLHHNDILLVWVMFFVLVSVFCLT